MSEMSERARSKAKAKAERMSSGDPHQKVDASSWTPPESMNTESKTGMRPISRRQFKKGGKVMGEKSAMHAGRKPRAKGGALTAESLVNRNVKDANEDRAGTKFIGGMKKGGRAHKMMGGGMMGRPEMNGPTQGTPPVMARPGMRPQQRLGMRAFAKGGKVHGADCGCGKCSGGRVGKADGGKTEFAANKALAQPKGANGTDYFSHVGRMGMKGPEPKTVGMATKPMWSAIKGKKGGGSVSDGTLQGMRPAGGRMARKGGGRAKKGMNVNIIIAPGGGAKPPMAMPPPPPPGGPVGLHQGAPPPMAPPGAAPPMGPPPMGRKRGGRAGYPIDSGAGGGLGRLEKARAYG